MADERACVLKGRINNISWCITHEQTIVLCFDDLRRRVETLRVSLAAAKKQNEDDANRLRAAAEMVHAFNKDLSEAEAVNQVWRRHLVGTDSPHIECMFEMAAKAELADLKHGIDASGVGDLVGENAALQTRLAEADRLLRLVWPFLGFETTEGQSLESLRLDIQHHLRVSDTEKKEA